MNRGMHKKGETWNESEVYKDSWTLRNVRRVTTERNYNQMPCYHTNTAFSADGEFIALSSMSGKKTAVFICHVPTGDITQLTDWRDANVENICIVPRKKFVLYVHGSSLMKVNYETFEEFELIHDVGEGVWISGAPSIDCDENNVVLPVSKISNREAYGDSGRGDWSAKLFQVSLEGKGEKLIYEVGDEAATHSAHCPTDSDLLIFNRDASEFWDGKNFNTGRRTNRIWTLEISTGKLAELPPLDEAKFQVHSVWTWDGKSVIYHGGNGKNGGYIGITGRDGETIREYGYQHTPGYYGHVAAMPDRPAIILDGNISNDLLVWMYYDQEKPRVEVIARHGTDWQGGQRSHPHPQTDPAGRRIGFNSARKGRSDVFVVDL